MGDLRQYRNEIDELDKQLIDLFEKRMNVVLKVAQYKKDNNVEVLQNSREEQVLDKAVDNLNNKDYANEARRFLSATMAISRSLQNRKINNSSEKIAKNIQKGLKLNDNSRIGFAGVRGSFTEEAALKFFGDKHENISYAEFEDVCIALKNEEIDYGVLPIENSSTGAIALVLDLIKKYKFHIVGEECIKIHQHLLTVKGTKIEDIKEVYSHPQGLAQSREFLKHFDWKQIPYSNTATSAKYISELGDKSKAAISGTRAAELYNLEILKDTINTQEENTTRFAILSRDIEVPEDSNKISVMFSLDNKVGTLYNVLRYFSENNINMIKIESRPIKNTPWEYFFYVDFEGDINSVEVINAIKLIEENSAYFSFLGAYVNKMND